VKKTGSVEKKRFALSAEYAKDDWTFRSEYIFSKGFGGNSIGSDGKACDKADGFYALCIAPIVKNKMHVKARYDTYRDKREWSSSKTYYEVGADYLFTKNLQLNLEYARVNERTGNHNYNLVDLELDITF
jgi:predicted porin